MSIERTLIVVLASAYLASHSHAQPPTLNRVEQSLQSPQSGASAPVQGYAGFEPDEEAEDGKGVHVKGVRAGTPADTAGLKPGDLIVNIDGKRIRNLDDYDSVIKGRFAGSKLVFMVDRNGRQQSLAVVLGAKGTHAASSVSDQTQSEPQGGAPALTAPGGTSPLTIQPSPASPPTNPGSFGSGLQSPSSAPSLSAPSGPATANPSLAAPVEPSPRSGGITAQPLDVLPPGRDSFSAPGASSTPSGPAAGGAAGGGASLGITVGSSDAPASRARRRGAYIAAVRPGTPAATAGLPVGGVIVQMDGQKINSDQDLVNAIGAARPGQEVELTYYDSADRLGKKMVRLAEAGGASGAASTPPAGGFGAPGGGFGSGFGSPTAQNPGAAPATSEPSIRPGFGGSGRPLINRVENLARGAGILPPAGPTGPTTVYDPVAMATLQRQVADLINAVNSLEERLRAVEGKSGITSPASGSGGGATSPFGTTPSVGGTSSPSFGSPNTPGFGSPSPSLTPGFTPPNP